MSLQIAKIPLRWVGPIKMRGDIEAELTVPMATYETTLWPSTNRGAKISRLVGGVTTTLQRECMTRSTLFEATSATELAPICRWLAESNTLQQLSEELATVSRFTQLQHVHTEITGCLLFVRFEFLTGDAAGHNMVTKASEILQHWILKQQPALRYVSLSANYCTDKKVSSVNGILGRGKHVIAEMLIPNEICQKHLHSSATAIHELNQKKNLVGSTLAGSLRSANAHYANILLACYLATGQDAANIVEGSQGITYTEVRDDYLYFSVTLPHLIVGSIGHGKQLDFVTENLTKLGCLEERATGLNAKRLAAIIAAAVCCGELSLMAALTNPTELMRAHTLFERQKK